MTGPAKIQRLSPQVVELIAAGEVIQRPVAAVKELVENSLDAGATSVSVAITGGGVESIRVTDNGGGIAQSDLLLAFAAHATSKLHRAEDLFSIATLGFRGEALASIARVSKVVLTTRQAGQTEGSKAVNEGGEMMGVSPAASAPGTSVLVNELFYNAPVRRAFLSKPARETLLCAELMEQLILSRPDVAFRFSADGKTQLQSPGGGDRQGAVLAVFGTETMKAMKVVDGGQLGVLVQGHVGVGEQSRANRSRQFFFINGRAVKSAALSRALEEGTKTRVMIGRFPVCALSLQLPFEAVDVNVHPNKWEVRFREEAAVMQAVSQAVADALQESPLDSPAPLFPPQKQPPQAQVSRYEPLVSAPEQAEAPEPETKTPQRETPEKQSEQPLVPWEAPPRSALVARDAARETPPQADFLANDVSHETKTTQAQAPKQGQGPEQTLLPPVAQSQQKVQVIGQVFDTYLVAVRGDRLLLIDQHALHERMLFDQLMRGLQEGSHAQTLLVSPTLELDYPAYQAFLANQEALREAGYSAEGFGGRSVRLLTVPMALGEPEAASGFLDALYELSAHGSLNRQVVIERIMMASCKRAVKGNQRLPDQALQDLADEMAQQKTSPTCPHGRPIVLELTRTELERRFQRIQH